MPFSHGFAGETIIVEGLDQLIRDFNKIDPELRRGMQRELDKIGKIVADDAKADVTARGLVRSGDMRKGIRQRVRGGTVVIRSSATHRGYNYPKVFEFGGRSGQVQKNGSVSAIRNRSTVGQRMIDMNPGMTSQGDFGEYGPQAILLPALVRNEEKVMLALEDMFDRLVSQNGFNTGGIL
jgi:hypothetical protein